ncbi:MAG: TauD/TfdA family dioxygenase [Flavobacteriales bacterium]
MQSKTTVKINKFNRNKLTSQSIELSEFVRQQLNEVGYVVIEDFCDNNNIDLAKSEFLNLCHEIGYPISHDVNNSIIWDIKNNSKSNSFIKTYSEHNHEAEFHTDSQYSSYPEDYFGLYTIRPAQCNGGKSYLLSLKDILTELRSIQNGYDIEKILSETNFPFIVPNVFKKESNNDFEYNFGPILRSNEIRFRIDTFEKAIIQRPDFCTEKQIEAYNILKEIILKSQRQQSFYLKEKDLIFINNKTMLHGRSSFTDENRHLLRIRMNKINLDLN